MIYGNAVMTPVALKTVILEDENGNSMTGVIVGEETVFTANAATDIREGKVAATDEGVVTGSKRIPSYETTKAGQLIFPGESYTIPLSQYDKYDYTKFQCMIAKYEESPENSVSINKIGIDDNIYVVNSSAPLSNITKNTDTKSIDLNIVNDTDDYYYVHYFTYKES